MNCPQCNKPLVQVGQFWICPEHGQAAREKPIVPLRIFLSYGHDDNEELVRRIHADLKQRGHDVWFDKNEIKFGDEWRRAITDGILQSNHVLSFLSKHSTRDPGVCRDEIAIAIGVKGANIIKAVLVENERVVQSPVSISHIQWLDMHDWKDGHGVVRGAKDQPAAGDADWEAWYRAKLAEIVRVVESEEGRRFAGEIEALNEHLKPIKSDARIAQLLGRGFCGREWLFDAVEKWLKSDDPGTMESRLFWIMGSPGVGKSAFAAQLTHTRGETVLAAQFCEWDKPDHRNASRVVRSLAFQLATRLPDYRRILLTLPEIAELDRKNADELFAYLLSNPLRSVVNGGRKKSLIVVDALDEAGVAGRNPLVEMLARHASHLPDWLAFVITSRPEFDVRTPLQALNPLPLETHSESNRADIRDYLRRELATHLTHQQEPDRLIERILDGSEGVFLYAERFCADLRQGFLMLDRPDRFPRGLGGVFSQYFQRHFPVLTEFRRDVRPVLRIILAAREPLPVELLQRLFGWQDEQIRDFTRMLGSLFPVTRDGETEVIKPYHKSLVDWLTDEGSEYYTSIHEGDTALAEFCWREYCLGKKFMSIYSRRHLPDHLVAAGRWDQTLLLLKSRRFFHDGWDARISSLSLTLSAIDQHGTLFADHNAVETVAVIRRELEELERFAHEAVHNPSKVTVLFADLVGFTSLSTVLSAEELAEMLQALWQLIDAAIVSCGGRLILHLGDGVMAVWGADGTRVPSTGAAIRAAFKVHEAAETFSRESRRDIKVRIGLDTENVQNDEASAGTDEAFEAIKTTAAKMVRAARPGEILISSRTHREVATEFEVAAQPVQVKRGRETVLAHVVIGPSTK